MLVIEGRVYLDGRLEPAAIGVEDGRIAAIRKTLRGDPTYRYSDAVVLPGGVDVHVHFREPGMTEKDDFASGTESAATGGVTCVADMPNTRPPVVSADALREKLRIASRTANVDFGLYAAPATAADAEGLREATAFKAYLSETTNAVAVRDDATLAGILLAASRMGKVLSAHCEDPTRFRPGTARGLDEHDRLRPAEAEVSAVERLARLRGGARVHVAHVTTASAAKARPAGATCEVTPHHLLLDTTLPLGSRAKVNPPVRTPAEREGLWREVIAGRIDMFASDHAPHTLDEKAQRFEDAPAGVPGVATTFPLLFRYVRREVLDLSGFVAMFSENPARLLGANKGRIEVGKDADLLVVDPRRIEKVTAKRCRYKCGWTPFEGLEGTFPIATFVRGELVAQEGELVADKAGRMLPTTEAQGFDGRSGRSTSK
jgi:dihydroorotase